MWELEQRLIKVKIEGIEVSRNFQSIPLKVTVATAISNAECLLLKHARNYEAILLLPQFGRLSFKLHLRCASSLKGRDSMHSTRCETRLLSFYKKPNDNFIKRKYSSGSNENANFIFCCLSNWQLKMRAVIGASCVKCAFVYISSTMDVYRHRFKKECLQLHKRNSMLESSAGIWNIFFCIFHHPVVAFLFCFSFSFSTHVTCERYQNRIMAALSSLTAARWISLFFLRKFMEEMATTEIFSFRKFQIISQY